MIHPSLAAILPASSGFLTKGKILGDEVTLTVGPVYSTGFLIGGAVLMFAALILVVVMYQRVKYFARDFGDGGFGGRMSAISGPLIVGVFLIGAGGVLGLIGWGNQGYSVVLSANGLTESSKEGLKSWAWKDLDRASSSERVKSTSFTLVFRDGAQNECRVHFHEQDLGTTVQDKAIAIAEGAISLLPAQ